jgi:hypothetical protein
MTNPWRAEAGVVSSFAAYGALHAAAFAASQRAPKPPWRQALFVAAGALLSVLTVSLALYGVRFVRELPALAGPLALLASSSVIGALAYATLIRKVWRYEFRLTALAATSLLCMAATFLGFVAGRHYGVLNSLCVAIPWWFAFSGSLWCQGILRSSRINR